MISQNLLYTILGYFGSCMIGSMLIPQVYLTINTKKTDDISLEFLIINMVAVSTMLPYSIYFKLYPVLIANFSVGICNSILLYYKIQNRYIKNKQLETEIQVI